MRNVNVNEAQNQQSCQTSVMVSADLVNKIHNENCLETMAKMPDCFIDLTVTSPPYDGLRTYNGYSFDFESIAKELYRVTKNGGVVVWVVGDATINGSETGTSFKQALFFKECGFNLHDTMIYKKTGCPYPDRNRYYQNFEYMFLFSKGKPKTTNIISDRKNIYSGYSANRPNSGNRQIDGSIKQKSCDKNGIDKKIKDFGVRYNIWEIPHVDKSRGLHPATFPEQLANDHIISWSNENDIVYDCFAGSGTAAKMSVTNNRKWIASEMSSEYCEIIKERVKIDKGLFENVS